MDFGSEFQVVDDGGVISLVPVSLSPITNAAGLLKGKSSLTKALLKEHRQELENER